MVAVDSEHWGCQDHANGRGYAADGITRRKHGGCVSVVKIPVVHEVRITR
jgi:hypothetical protein